MGILVLLFLSIVLLGFGIYRLIGPVSVWYLAYGVGPVEFNYIAIPGGITLAIWALAASPLIPQDWQLNFLIIGTICGFLAVIPGSYFLKPSWLRWLEREHREIIPLLRHFSFR
jgi:hypothetical protein